MPFNELKEAKKIIQDCDALLIIVGAGMSVDSGIFTYRGVNGIWEKSIEIGNKKYRYDEISSLKMWKTYPELAWGFKANFYKMMNENKPHQGYHDLLNFCQNHLKNNYFICTSNIDNYFESSGFDKNKIYEVHGTMKYMQCLDKKCAQKNGVFESYGKFPIFDKNTFIAKNLPKCPNCNNILRPNVSMFGDYDFYEEPCKYSKKNMNQWLSNIEKRNQKCVILEIGCGENPHSLKMNDGVMLSGEWKLPKITNFIKTIILNPEDQQKNNNTIHLKMGAQKGLKSLLAL